MLAPGRLGGRLGAAAIAVGLAACASGRQVYQTAQGPGSITVFETKTSPDGAPLVSLSGAAAGSDQILQLSGNVVLPVYRLDTGLGADIRVSLPGTQLQASLAASAPALLGAANQTLGTTAGAVDRATTQAVGAAEGQVAAPQAASPVNTSPGVAPALQTLAAPAPSPVAPVLAPSGPLTPVDLGGALGSTAPPPSLPTGAVPGGAGAVAGATTPINAAVASLPRLPAGR